ncbi:hypothetical protein HQ496_01095 [bacterium]|nr:hypothetical protein [bacterium]
MSVLDITQIASLIEADNSEEARALLSDLLQVIPNHLSATVLLAKLHDANRDIELAYQYWKRAAFLCPGNPVIEKGLRRAVTRRMFASPQSPGFAPVELADPESWEAAVAPAPEPESPSKPETAPIEQHQPAHAEPSSPEYQDLDKLISELETARIVPDPNIEMIPQGELETEIDDVVSETLARIYANQKFFEEAAVVYDKLAVQRPDKAAEFLQKAQELRKKSSAKN